MSRSFLIRFISLFENSPFWASLISGVLTSLTFMSMTPWILSFSLFPVVHFWVTERSTKKLALSGWLFQFSFSLCTMYWIKYTAWTFFGVEGIGAWLFLLGFSLLAFPGFILLPTFLGLLRNRYQFKTMTFMILLVTMGTLTEMLVPRLLPYTLGMPWFGSHADFIQWADVIGFGGLSVLTFASAALLSTAFLLLKSSNYNRSILAVLAIPLLFALLTATGMQRKAYWSQNNESLHFHIQQPNIEPIELLQQDPEIEDAVTHTLDHFTQQSSDISKEAELLIWNETAMPFSFSANNPHLGKLKQFVQELGVPLITGGYWYEEDVKFNSVIAFGEDAEINDVYSKQILMPFGEYLPGESHFPSLRELAPMVPSYGVGKRISPIKIKSARLGVSICYETLITSHLRRLTAEGANLFLSVSSDFWFGDSFQPLQHSLAAQISAIELRRPLVRVVDSGISSITLATGEELARSPLWESWSATIEVPFRRNPPRSIYDRHGNKVIMSLIGLLITSLFSMELRKRRHNE